ncbi:exported protein of unknown function [Nitrospira sp. KM1]|uniref:caspase family protein n=1 Tax=Nitrospira sp. KM1 TaxID=1936990 RepID=UPI0013A7320D|nr:hypothetical protein [Nitrospira sp. KM1]BCA55947.1 exported protein of unknown function [Nitrospira sp. KM1]
MIHTHRGIKSRLSTAAMVAGFLTLLLEGCGLFSSRDGLGAGYYLPLTVQLRANPSVAAAQVTYQDACGQERTLPIGESLSAAITRKTGRVFQKVVSDEQAGAAVDGYEDVSVGLATLDLLVTRKVKKSYPATLTIGLDFAYTAADGTVLFQKKLQSLGSGEVDASASSCDVTGLEQIAHDAIERVTDGMAIQLGTSSKVLEAARKAGSGTPTPQVSVPPSPIPSGISAAAPLTMSLVHTPSRSSAPAVPGGPATLTFRAIVRDENRNQVLHPGEALSVEIEITNDGPGDALGVEVMANGTPELVEQIPSVVPVGDIPRGDVKRISVEGKAGTIKEALQAELTLSMRTTSPSDQLPQAKRFVISMKPESAPGATAAPVDVDEIPKSSGKLKQPKAIGIAVGIGQFRDPDVPQVKYASRDAEVMGGYWQAVSGILPDRIRRLTDHRALKDDLIEALEEWLPAKADASTVVYLYVSGRGVVDASTGAVSIVPFDGHASGTRMYSLRRLHESLTRLPIYRAIVMLDLSLETIARQDGLEPAAPVWEQSAQGKDKVLLMVGNRSVQEAHAYDPGHHGLFTYEVLKGMAGAADVDKDGQVLAGELCAYVKGEVRVIAREQFGNEQEPFCIPGPNQGASVRLQPISKIK